MTSGAADQYWLKVAIDDYSSALYAILLTVIILILMYS